jgi:hypothetical protein
MNKSLSAGCVVGGLIVGGFFFSVAVFVALFAFGYLSYRGSAPALKDKPFANSNAPATQPSSGGAAGAQTGERPTPTTAQQAALAGGKTASWSEQGLEWTVPPSWSQQEASPTSFLWKSPGGGDAGWLNVNVSTFPDTFPADVSLDAMYTQALDQQKLGNYTEVRLLEIDGVKGVQFKEKDPSSADDVRRIQWQAYRKRPGQVQLLNVMVHATGQGFAKHEDELYAVLYSTRVSP